MGITSQLQPLTIVTLWTDHGYKFNEKHFKVVIVHTLLMSAARKTQNNEAV